MIVSDLSIDGTSIFDAAQFAALGGVMQVLFSRPSPRPNVTPRPGVDGSIDRTARYDAREFTLPGRIRVVDGNATSFLSAHDTLGILLETGVDHVLRASFSNGTARELVFRVVGDYAYDGETNFGAGTFAVSCLAAEPRWFDAAETVLTYDPLGTTPGGMTNPFTSPIDGGGAGTAFATAINAGTVWTPPVYEIDGPYFGPFIRNDTTDVTLYLTTSDLSSTDTLTIDTKARAVYVNDVLDNSRVDWSASDGWPYYVRGANVLVFGGAPASGSQIRARHRHAWI